MPENNNFIDKSKVYATKKAKNLSVYGGITLLPPKWRKSYNEIKAHS